MTPEQIATLEQALDDAGVRYRSDLYEGAVHGYTMSDTPVYDQAAAERHFTRYLRSSTERSPPPQPAAHSHPSGTSKPRT
jgi:dienelactone hydrolase